MYVAKKFFHYYGVPENQISSSVAGGKTQPTNRLTFEQIDFFQHVVGLVQNFT